MAFAALLLLLLLLLGTACALAGLRDSEQWIMHTNEVRIELSNLQVAFIDAETGQRGYLAAGQEVFLEPYTRALGVWRSSFDKVRNLTADNPRQQRLLADLEPLLEHKLDDMKSGLEARKRGAPSADLLPLLVDGKLTMDAIQAVIADMQREEVLLYEQRRRASVRNEQALFALLFAAGIALSFAGVSAWATRNRQQRADRARLAELTRALEETTRYRLLVDSVQDATFILDPKGRITTWNAAAERIKGYKAAEIIGKHLTTFYPPEDVTARKADRELEGAARDGVFVDEGWRLRKDGSRLWASVVVTAMRDESGRLVGFAKVTRDLTERVQNEEKFRKLAAEKAVLEITAKAERTLRARRDFLAKSGEVLASSLDYRTTLAAVANLAVPELADWCSVELLEPEAAAPVQVAIAHTDPQKVQLVRELGERYPPDPNAPSGAPQVIRSGQSELYVEIPAALLEAAARDGEHLRIIRELQLESAMVVPLKGRDRVLGALSFVYANSGRRYSEGDSRLRRGFRSPGCDGHRECPSTRRVGLGPRISGALRGRPGPRSP